MKKKLLTVLVLIFLFFAPSIFAENIILKSGKTVEGKIIEKTDKGITIDIEGTTASYDFDDIDSIDNQKINSYNIFPDAPEDSSFSKSSYDKNMQPGQLDEAYWSGNDRGIMSMNSGDYASAIKEFEASKEMTPTSAAAYLNLGIVYKKMGEDKNAITFLQEAASLAPEDSNIYYNLGNVYLELLEDYQGAMQSYLTAIQKNPDDGKAYVNLGIVYARLGQYLEAKKSFKAAKKMFENAGNQNGVDFVEQNLKAIPGKDD